MDRYLTQRADLLRAEAGLRQKYLGMLRTLEDEIVALVKEADPSSHWPHTQAQLEALDASARGLIKRRYADIAAAYESELQDLVATQAKLAAAHT